MNEFSFIYHSKLFWNNTSFEIEYDISNYRIDINTGVKLKEGVMYINKQTDIHVQAQNMLRGLLNEVENTVPRIHAQKILKLFDEIR